MQPQNPPILPDFGEPLDDSVLLDFATVTASDMESAIQWFDEHASEEWQGALENKPVNKGKR